MRAMERQYRLMYRLGLTPWDQDGTPPELARVVEGPAALPPGVALDIGCGTGRHAAYLARNGWQVTGFDVSPRAVERAKERSAAVRWHVAGIGEASVERVVEPLGGRVSLVLDVGCLHGLDAAGRRAWGVTVGRVAAPDARLLLRAAPPRSVRSFTPRGIGPAEVSALLGPQWARADSDSLGWSVYQRTPNHDPGAG
jgi:SAM-dependent methyltransferase